MTILKRKFEVALSFNDLFNFNDLLLQTLYLNEILNKIKENKKNTCLDFLNGKVCFSRKI